MKTTDVGEETNAVTPQALFRSPTSVIVLGSDRPLLNWVAYALASAADPEFIWWDVRFPSEVLAETDVLSRGLIPSERMQLVGTSELARNEADQNIAVSAVVRGDEPPNHVRRLVDFLGLPTRAQELLSSVPRGPGPRVLVLSNGHRVVALYPSLQIVAQTVRAIVEANSSLIMTFADAAPEGRLAFDCVLHLGGSVQEGWRRATLTVEKAPAHGPFESGRVYRLEGFPPVASALAAHLG